MVRAAPGRIQGLIDPPPWAYPCTVCGRFTQHWTRARLAGLTEPYWNIPDFDDDPAPRYDIAPTQPALVIRACQGPARIDTLRWGLANPARPGEIINARIETADQLPMFKDAARARRCLIPADAFYEWEPTGDGGKQPWALAPLDGVLLLAGLWEHTPAGDRFVTLTCGTPPGFEPRIHHRMPCVVRPRDGAAWLDPGHPDGLRLAMPFGDPNAFPRKAWPVSTRVNSTSNDDPRLLEPIRPDAGLFG